MARIYNSDILHIGFATLDTTTTTKTSHLSSLLVSSHSNIPFLQVLRWSALGAGVVYGFVHNSSLKSTAAANKATNEFAKKEALIAQAKAKYAELHPKPVVASTGAVNFDDPKFDLEAYLTKALSSA